MLAAFQTAFALALSALRIKQCAFLIGHLRAKACKKSPGGSCESSGLRGGGYLLFHFRSIIGVARFNFSVRNGKRWSPCAIATLVRLQQALRCADSLIARLSVREGRRFSLPSCAAALCGVKKESGSPSFSESSSRAFVPRGSLPRPCPARQGLRWACAPERVWVISIARL